ncbi:hypothetical protein CDD82_5527 [Ophiocordyceps australis]|uniref:Uncharacterized protein n=1 Tax=Ophiocordyceps australis TaxID=1399860 RepID=A0A2C5XI86_9HYPO|nr:hypothetical protein CDD82_5527 [Ophiocordyceps australis]
MSQSPEWTGQHRESSRGGRSYHDGLMSMQGKEEARRRGSQSPEHKRRRMVEERRRRSTSRDSKCREARVRMRQGPLRHEAHLNRWDSRTGDADENGHDDSQDRRSHHHHHGHDGRNSRGPESSHRRRRQHRREATGVELPFGVRQLSKKDFETFGPLFTHYLAVQKQKQVQGMDERELRGRWKSFVGRWNRGELAEGWYDPDMFARIAEWTPEPQLMELDECQGKAQE